MTAQPVPVRTTALRDWLPAYLALAVVWGCSFAFVRTGLTALTPVQVAFWRLVLGALALGVLAVAMRTRLPRDRTTWRHLAVFAALQNAVPFTLLAIGQQHVPSVLAAIINAATPLSVLTFVLVAFPEEHPTRRRVAGLVTGFVGILVVLGVWRELPTAQWQGVAACVGAVLCYGLAIPYARRHLSGAPEGPVALATGQVTLAALLLLPVVAVTGVTPHGPVTAGVVGSMLAVGVLGSGLAFAVSLHLIATVGTTTTSTVTYLTPVVAAAVGVLALGERLAWHEPVGAVVVLAGVVLAQGVPLRLRPGRRGTGSAEPERSGRRERRDDDDDAQDGRGDAPADPRPEHAAHG
jgi:drug/metabolite transporter (DMT)-like permease